MPSASVSSPRSNRAAGRSARDPKRAYSARCALSALAVAAAISCTSSPHRPSPSTTARTEPLLAEAYAQLTAIRPRDTIDPAITKSADLSVATAAWPIIASVTFRTTPDGVDLTLLGVDCRTAYSYPVRIYASSDCATIEADSQPWDGARGTLSDKAICLGGPGARIYESRANADPKPWSIGGAAASNLVGRTIAIHDPDTLEPLACGGIELSDGGVPWIATAATPPPSLVVAQLAGLCGLGPIPTAAADDAQLGCPNVDHVASCALTHCLSGCLDTCADYAACLAASPQACMSSCQPDDACRSCLPSVSQCMLGFCQADISCAPPPTAGGPCTELRECCMRQGPLVEGCLSLVQEFENLSGDPSCIGALSDVDFNGAFAFRSPCYPDGGAPMQ
ncbi:MAG TPA: hypothetical protein VGI70_08460 [Polyangiales bacterium]